MTSNKIIKKSALSSAILVAMGSVHATTINVDNDCSLSEALETANSDLPVGTCEVGNGADVIQVVTENSNMVINTIFESSVIAPGDVGLPIITSEVTIEGNGLTIQAEHNNYNFRVFQVEQYGDLTLKDTTISGANDGYGVGSGVLVYQGRVTLENTTFALSHAPLWLVLSYNNIIENSVFRHNFSTGSTPFSAAITSLESSVDISNTAVVNNRLLSAGGPPPPPFTVNRGGSGPTLSGGMSLIQSEVTVTNSTISKNQSIYGGGITVAENTGGPRFASAMPEFVRNSTRGMIQNNVTITNSTITENESYVAAGILNFTYLGTLTIQGSIIAGNKELYGPFAANIYSDPNGVINLDANNIIGDRGYSGTYGVTLGASDSSFINAAEDNLYPLTVTNGQMLHPLKVNSSAIDGNDLLCYGSITDQEGKGRGKDGDDNGSFICDVGAFEHTLPIMADGAPCTFASAITSANNDVSFGGCQPGRGHDIIMLPENSTQSFAEVVYNFYAYGFASEAITSGITIEGNGSTFERDPAAVDDFDLFFVSNDQLNLINSTVTGFNGLIASCSSVNGGNASILNSTLTNNLSTGFVDLGSINSSVINSTVSDNQYALSGISAQFAAGVSSINSVGFELRNSTINGNVGYLTGGVDIRNGVVQTVENSTISGNLAVRYGGLVSTTLPSFGLATSFNGLTITNNEGSAVGGALMYNYDPNASSLITNSIISGNALTPPVPRTVTLSGGGLLGINQQGGLLQTLSSGQNTQGVTEPRELNLIANNTYLNGNNVLGFNGDSGTVGATFGPSDQVPVGPTSDVIETNLADNGGTTLTHALAPGSIAIDSGDTFCFLTSDQVGNMRPWDGDGDDVARCDAGAVESGSIPVNDIIFKDGFDAVIMLRGPAKKL